MLNLLSPSFWFNLRPGSMSSAVSYLFLGIIAVSLVLTIILFFLKKNKGIYRRFFISLYNFFIANTAILAMLWFFNHEIVPFFSAYFWFLIWFIIVIWWLIMIFKKLKQTINKQKSAPENDEIKKYLP